MTLKLGILALALFLAWVVLFRPGRSISKPKSPPPAPPQALEPCPDCGVFRLPGGACDCDPRSTSRN